MRRNNKKSKTFAAKFLSLRPFLLYLCPALCVWSTLNELIKTRFVSQLFLSRCFYSFICSFLGAVISVCDVVVIVIIVIIVAAVDGHQIKLFLSFGSLSFFLFVFFLLFFLFFFCCCFCFCIISSLSCYRLFGFCVLLFWFVFITYFYRLVVKIYLYTRTSTSLTRCRDCKIPPK